MKKHLPFIFLLQIFLSVQLNGQSTLDLKLFFEGYYTGGGMMQPVLYNQTFGQYPNMDDCDTINVSILDPVNYSLVQSERTILHVDGTCTVDFTAAVPGNSYYIDICHRNTVQTISAMPVVFTSNVAYDFSTSASKAYGNNMTEVEPGVWAFYTGNVQNDGSVDGLDFLIMDIDVYNTVLGYVCTDITGDGVVESADYAITENNVYLGIGSILPADLPACPACATQPPCPACVNNGYNCYLKNTVQIAPNVFEFEIWIEKTGPSPNNLEFFQGGISFNYTGMANGGTITGAFVSGSASALPSVQQSPSWKINQSSKMIRMMPAVASPSFIASVMPGAPGYRLGKFRVTNTVPFAANSPTNFVWNFLPSVSNGTQTVVASYLNNSSFGSDMTQPNPATNAPGNTLAIHTVQNIILNPSCPVVNAGGPYQCCGNIQLNGSINNTGGIWTTSGSGVFLPSNTTLNGVYQPSAADLSAGSVTLTLTSNTVGSCQPVVSNATATFIPVNDNDVCTIDICDNILCLVSHPPVNVDDGTVCTIDGCNSITGVYHTPVNTDDNNPCTIDFCDLGAGIIHMAVSVDDGDPCTVDNCDSSTGIITHVPGSPPAAPSIIYSNGFCDSIPHVFVLSIDQVQDATTYYWFAPSGANITAGQGTTEISGIISPSFDPGNITLFCVYAVNACGHSDTTCFFCPGKDSCQNCIGSFIPEPDVDYIFSAWVREEGAPSSQTDMQNPSLVVEFPSSNASPVTCKAQGPVIEGWQKIYKKIRVPSQATDIKITLTCDNGYCLFDDVRVFPDNGMMKSYVYDPVNLRFVAELDEENYASFYLYDEEGKLTTVKKETERGIMTIKTNRSSIRKR